VANQTNRKLWCINYTSYVLKNSVLTYSNFLCTLEFYTTLLVYLFFLASQWFHTFKSFSNYNLHFLGLAFFLHQRCFWNRISHLFWDSTIHKNTCMHFLGINCLFRKFKVVFIDRWSFYTGSTVIVHHKNNNVLIPP